MPARSATPAAPGPTRGIRERRFRDLDTYRVRREWLRYEGTPQRDLFRQLRERFLQRHAAVSGWVVDLGSGPGRFLSWVGTDDCRRVALDLSSEALRFIAEHRTTSRAGGEVPDRVRGNALRPPLNAAAFTEVVVIGNTAGFSGSNADLLVDRAAALTAPAGKLLLEIAPGPGERSRYLARLPTTTVGRLLRSPVAAVRARVEREEFRAESARHAAHDDFRRYTVPEITARLEALGFQLGEVVAVAPALGPDAARIAAVRRDAKAWRNLLELEEVVGREPGRWPAAAAVLVAASRPS